jgi:hypothetical protein
MRIASWLPTHHIPEEALPWITEARNVFDEMVIFIDEKRVTPGTLAHAKRVGSRVVNYKAEGWLDMDCLSMVTACESDWVFLLEYDEQLSPEWRQQDTWRQILETTQFTNFWLPRRWNVSSRLYIDSNPWWPDFQLRLFRNNLQGTMFPTKLHEHIRIPGPAACFQNLAIHHHVLWLLSREQREAKAAYYEQLRPGFGSGHYYLYEDYRPSQAPLPESTSLDFDREIIRMDALSREEISGISIKLMAGVNEVTVSEMFWLDLEVMNATNVPLYSCPPFPVHLSYHWIDPATRQMIAYDGQRSGVFPCAPANAITPWKMVVLAPNKPGEYILQMTVVQDGIQWLENVNPAILQEHAISVMAKKLVTSGPD